MPYNIRTRRQDTPSAAASPRPCEWPGCAEDAAYRAPHSPRHLKIFRWFCLEHVRCYNASWNYYDGMTEGEVEADRRCDTVWQRPSWTMGSASGAHVFGRGTIRDDFGIFGEAPPPPGPPPSEEEQALLVLDLRPPVTVTMVKSRYKELVKRHHPDANGGDRAAEERFKAISAAYRTVLNSLAP